MYTSQAVTVHNTCPSLALEMLYMLVLQTNAWDLIRIWFRLEFESWVWMFSCFSDPCLCNWMFSPGRWPGTVPRSPRVHCQYEWGLWIILYWPENNGATFQSPPSYTKIFKFTHENRIQFLDLSSLYARLILNEHYFSSTPRHKYSLSVKSLHVMFGLVVSWTFLITNSAYKMI